MTKIKYYQTGSKFDHLIKLNEDLKKPTLKKGIVKPKTKTQADVAKEQVAKGYTSMDPFGELLDLPSKGSTYLLSGNYEMPSEALNIQNPVGKFLTDAVLDPTNLAGIGLLSKVGKLGKLGKAEKATDALSTLNKADQYVLGNMRPVPRGGNYLKSKAPKVSPAEMNAQFKADAAERLQELSSTEGRRRLRAFAGDDIKYTDKQINNTLDNIKDTKYDYIDNPNFTRSVATTTRLSPLQENLRKFTPSGNREALNNVLVNGADVKDGLNARDIWNHEFNHIVTNAVERNIGEKPMGTWTAGIDIGYGKTLPQALNSKNLKNPIKGEFHDYFNVADEFPSHLAELRSIAKREGLIKNNYDFVSDDAMRKFIDNRIKNNPDYSRMDYIMKSHDLNDRNTGLRSFHEIMKRYNNLPAVVPALIGTGVVGNEMKKKYYNGGRIKFLQSGGVNLSKSAYYKAKENKSNLIKDAGISLFNVGNEIISAPEKVVNVASQFVAKELAKRTHNLTNNDLPAVKYEDHATTVERLNPTKEFGVTENIAMNAIGDPLTYFSGVKIGEGLKYLNNAKRPNMVGTINLGSHPRNIKRATQSLNNLKKTEALSGTFGILMDGLDNNLINKKGSQ